MTPVPPPSSNSGPDQPDWPLLDRYLAGECSALEAARVRSWLAGDPGRVAMLADLESTRRVVAAQPSTWNTPAMWRAIVAEAVLPARDQHIPAPRPDGVDHVGDRSARPGRHWWPRGPKVSDRFPARRLLPVSAAFAAGLAVAAIGFAAIRGDGRAAGRRMPYREYATSAGQRQTITLTDGTRFILAPQSHLELMADYGARRREVYLDGEAYFSVTHDGRHPFVVHAGNGVAEDIGTHFAVRAYQHEPVMRVVVVDGAVSLADTSVRRTRRTTLTARTLGTVDRFGVTTATTGIDTEPYVAWTVGRLEFHATPMRTVVRELSRWYDLDVQLGDATLDDRLCTGSYTSQSPDQVLSLITAAVGARYERKGRTVTITTQ